MTHAITFHTELSIYIIIIFVLCCRSHDGFKEDANGYLEPENPKYASQKDVFKDLGQGVLDNAFQGKNSIGLFV